MSTNATGILVRRTLQFFLHNPRDSNNGIDNNKTENQQNIQIFTRKMEEKSAEKTVRIKLSSGLKLLMTIQQTLPKEDCQPL